MIEETYDPEEDEINLMLMEDAIRELRGDAEPDPADDDGPEDEVHTLNEQEAAEILATMVQRKRTFPSEYQGEEEQGIGPRLQGRKRIRIFWFCWSATSRISSPR